jgi:hypothetical protein
MLSNVQTVALRGRTFGRRCRRSRNAYSTPFGLQKSKEEAAVNVQGSWQTVVEVENF